MLLKFTEKVSLDLNTMYSPIVHVYTVTDIVYCSSYCSPCIRLLFTDILYCSVTVSSQCSG